MSERWTPARKGQLGIAMIDGVPNPIRVEATQKGTVTRLLRLATGEVCAALGNPDDSDVEIVYWSEVNLLNKGHFRNLGKLAERWGEIGNGKPIDAYKKVAIEHFKPQRALEGEG